MSKEKKTSPSPGSSGPGLDDPESGLTKAKLDDSELSDDLPKALQKVELDLDDAPFLEDEKEEEPPAPPQEEPAPQETEERAPPWWKKKPVIFGGAGLILILLALVAYLLFFSGKKTEAPPPPPPPAEENAEEQAPESQAPPAPEEPLLSVVMDPFLVEQTNEKGEVFLLTLQFSTMTKSPQLEKELARNAVVLRDAVYYFLKNKPLMYLDDQKTADTLKQDIMSVMNQFLGDEQIENLFIEKYVVK
jgi:flagellar FliL protein